MFKPGDKVIYYSYTGARIRCIVQGGFAPKGTSNVKVNTQRSSYYPYGLVFNANNTFLRKA